MSALRMPPCSQSEPSSRKNSSRNGISISTNPSSYRTSCKPKKRSYGDSNRSGWFMLEFLLEFRCEFFQLSPVDFSCAAQWHGLEEIDAAWIGIRGAMLQEELLQFAGRSIALL